jgi:stearoyl-CoA desaturase (delta-9 desaturase)
VRWLDTCAAGVDAARENRIDWLRIVPFIGMHAMCVGVVFVGFSWFAFWVAVAL